MIQTENKYRKWYKITAITFSVLLTIGLSAYLGNEKVSKRLELKQEIENKLFTNIEGIKFEGESAGLFSSKPYSKITITFPSFISKHDDRDNQEKANRVFSRVRFEQEIKVWLSEILNRDVAKSSTDRIILKYCDDVFLDEKY